MSGRSIAVSTVLVLLAACLAISGMACPRPQSAQRTLGASPTRDAVPPTYFGLNVIGLARNTPVPTIRFGAWRNFYSQWYRVEPTPGGWDFTELDREIALANDRGVPVTLVLGNPPTWASARPTKAGWFSGAPFGTASLPRRQQDWRTYVSTLANRYKGKVEAFELWNEPNNFLAEPARELVAFGRVAYAAIKEVDPRALVLSPAVSVGGLRYLDEYLAAGGGDTFDIVAVHLYVSTSARRTPRQPEEMLSPLHDVFTIMNRHGIAEKSLWNTETGWAFANRHPAKQAEGETFMGRALDPQIAAAYLARAYILSWYAGVRRLYWYAWGTSGMSLVDPEDGTPKLAARAYEEIQRWLTGKRIRSCNTDADSTWTCVLEDTSGEASCVIWNEHERTRFSIPLACPAEEVRDLEGQRHRVIGRTLDAEPAPVILGDRGD